MLDFSIEDWAKQEKLMPITLRMHQPDAALLNSIVAEVPKLGFYSDPYRSPWVPTLGHKAE